MCALHGYSRAAGTCRGGSGRRARAMVAPYSYKVIQKRRGNVCGRPPPRGALMPVPASTNQHGVINSNRSISVAAIVPGSIPLSLFAAKVWPDPYYGFLNQGGLNRSMALETNWSYTRTRLRGRCWRAGDHRARGKAAGDRRWPPSRRTAPSSARERTQCSSSADPSRGDRLP